MTRRTRPMRHARTPVSAGPSRRLTRRGVTVGAVVGLTLSALPAYAYWTSSAATSASAKTDTLQPPAALTATATGMTSIQLKVTALPGSGPTPSAYRILRGGTQICTAVTVTLNSTNCTDTNLAPGTAYTYTAVSLLQANWVSAGATSATTSTQAFPAPTVNSQAAGVGVTSDTTPTFAGTAPPNTSVTVRLDSNSTLGTTTSNASGVWSLSVTNQNTISRNVNHTVTARFANGAVLHESAALTLLIDTQAPSTGTASFSCTSTTVSGYCKDGSTTVSLSGVSDPTTGSGIASLTYSIAGGANGTVALTGGSGSFSYGSPDGTPSITLTATDGAGNSTSNSILASTPMDNTGPVVTGISLSNNGGQNGVGRADSGDTLAITLDDSPGIGVNPQSFCSTWSTSLTTQSITTAGVVTALITDNGSNDSFSVSLPPAGSTCGGTFNLGSVALNGNYVTTSASFTSSSIRWSGAGGNKSGMLTITLGTLQGSVNTNTTVQSANPTYTASSAIKDLLGHSVANSPYTGSPDRF